MKITYRSGTSIWVNSNGDRHRIKGPAIKCTDGTEQWFVNGRLHRLNGAATDINRINGRKSRYLNDNCHCINGPAIKAGSKKAWYINGVAYSEADYNRIMKIPTP